MNIQDSYAVHGDFQKVENWSQIVGALRDVAFDDGVGGGFEEVEALGEGQHCDLNVAD